MIERSYKDEEFKAGRHSFYIYYTVCDSLVIIRKNTIKYNNDYLKKCIVKTTKMHSNSVWKNMKKGESISSLSSDKVDEIYLIYSVIYNKGLAHYSYDYLYEGRKRL